MIMKQQAIQADAISISNITVPTPQDELHKICLSSTDKAASKVSRYCTKSLYNLPWSLLHQTAYIYLIQPTWKGRRNLLDVSSNTKHCTVLQSYNWSSFTSIVLITWLITPLKHLEIHGLFIYTLVSQSHTDAKRAPQISLPLLKVALPYRKTAGICFKPLPHNFCTFSISQQVLSFQDFWNILSSTVQFFSQSQILHRDAFSNFIKCLIHSILFALN